MEIRLEWGKIEIDPLGGYYKIQTEDSFNCIDGGNLVERMTLREIWKQNHQDREDFGE